MRVVFGMILTPSSDYFLNSISRSVYVMDGGVVAAQ
jgi:hypothetical protein